MIRLAPRPGSVTAVNTVLAARALLAAGEPERADDMLASLRDGDQRPDVATEVWLLTSLAADRLREDNRAAEALLRAVETAAVEDVRRPFVELYPAQVRRLLVLVRQLDPRRGFIEELIEQPHPHQVEPLHPRGGRSH